VTAPGAKERSVPDPEHKQKGENHADSFMAARDTDPADHIDHAAAPLTG
jgi:hypothetical protein